MIPFSLVTVRQPRTTTAAKTAIRKGQPCRCRLGPRHPTYHLESAVNGAKCDGELTVMEQPEAPSSARPIEVYRHPEHQVLGCRQMDNRIHSCQSILFHNRPITGIKAQHFETEARGTYSILLSSDDKCARQAVAVGYSAPKTLS